jgi:Diaminopimelate epimerase
MKQEIDFVKLNPTQNMTILVKSNHPAEEYNHIASQLMSYDSLHAEQVGFINRSSNPVAAANLQMAGGEFCGNACMSMAAYLADKSGMESNGVMEIQLESSGTNQLVSCRVRRDGDLYSCRVAMPLPYAVESKSATYGGEEIPLVLVKYEHAFHVVIEADRFSEEWRRKAEGLAKLLGIAFDSGLIGILMFNSDTFEMAPLIYLPGLDSMVWEKGCGSGTASVGAYLSWRDKENVSARIKQPGGTIQVSAEYGGQKVTSLQIEGAVSIVAHGKAFIDSKGSGQNESIPSAAPIFN